MSSKVGGAPVDYRHSDPANPYGSTIRWPERAEEAGRPSRSAGARVILFQGKLLAYMGRTRETLLTFFSDEQPMRNDEIETLLEVLTESTSVGDVLFINKIDGQSANEHWLQEVMTQRGFRASRTGLMYKPAYT